MASPRKRKISDCPSTALSEGGTTSPKSDPPIIVCFVHEGEGMPWGTIKTLTALAERRGATVVQWQCPQPPKKRRDRLWEKVLGPAKEETTVVPTHLVIHEDCVPSRVAKNLKFSNAEQMAKYLNEKNIQCAVPKWLNGDIRKRPLPPLNAALNPFQRWHKLSSIGRKQTKKKNGPTNIQRLLGNEVQSQFDKYRELSQQIQSQSQPQSQPQSQRKPNEPECPSDEEEENTTQLGPFPNNLLIAEQLQILGKLHQKCPLSQDDMWKSYSLDKVAGRIKNLGFEVTLGPKSQAKLAQVWGVGQSTRGKINEILKTGTCARIQEFQTDEQRVAMKNLIGIWGIGRSTATKMIQRGFRTIADVRERMDELEFDRNQIIGVQCYESILENMSRQEVEAIGKLIEEAIRRHFPEDKTNLEVTIMGSYRRGRDGCGDVDVLITHKKYIDTVPPQVLGEVVEDMLERGQMAFHLTYISGMKIRGPGEYHPGGFNVSDGIKPKRDKVTGSSYMGVFNSPTVKGKRRRVDIKFYPHRERCFAWLYFTGNGFFNRSMRLYATKRKDLLLNDKGLFTRATKLRVDLNPSTEKDVFDYLGLGYKEPHERDCFDAVQTDGFEVDDDQAKAFLKEEHDHKWID